jgi:CDP-paratose 2-epimerase
MRTILITGAWGLVGFECAKHFLERDWRVVGVDNDMRAQFFGPEASGKANQRELKKHSNYKEPFGETDIRDYQRVGNLFHRHRHEDRPDAIIHAAGQPAHQYGQLHPIENWEVNVTGTLNLLEAARLHTPEAPFVFLSSSKVYGTRINHLPMREDRFRYKYDFIMSEGLTETADIDQTFHTQYGASKAAADLLVQEYRQSYDMPTVCFRAGCMTGGAHGGVQMHGFLSHLTKTAVQNERYTIDGYKGKQVRDQLHASDVARACELFIESPRRSQPVYNLGGGEANSVSILEALDKVGVLLGRGIFQDINPEPREGDQIIVINDTTRFEGDYGWKVNVDLDDIFDELVESANAAAQLTKAG